MTDAEITTALDGIALAQKEVNAAVGRMNILVEVLLKELGANEDEDTF